MKKKLILLVIFCIIFISYAFSETLSGVQLNVSDSKGDIVYFGNVKEVDLYSVNDNCMLAVKGNFISLSCYGR